MPRKITKFSKTYYKKKFKQSRNKIKALLKIIEPGLSKKEIKEIKSLYLEWLHEI